MNEPLIILCLVVVTALAFDFTNGFHDTGNAMATSIATGALSPKTAVTLSAVLNLVGAFLSTAVAATIAKGLVDANLVTLEIVFAGLVGGITWNLLTWLLGIPSSSSHALIGGVIGAMLAAAGTSGVEWKGVVSNVVLPAVLSPLIAGLVATLGTYSVYRSTRGLEERRTERGFRIGQIGSASLVSLAHGTNDAQKTMGIIFLALISYGSVSSDDSLPPTWVIVSCAVAIALGTYLGGWRIIRTLGKGLTDIKPAQGFAAEASTASTILASSALGFALSTTQVASGSVIGSGLGRRGSTVRWRTVGRIAIGWLLTLPAAGGVGAAAALVVVWLGTWGVMIDAVLAVLIVLALFLRSRRNSVNASNAMSEVADSGKAVKVKRNPPPTRRQRAIAREEAREAARKAASERRSSGKKGQK